jgi:hypothetical protein
VPFSATLPSRGAPQLGSEKYMRPSPPSTIATAPHACPVATSWGVGDADVASNQTNLFAPLTVTHTRPPEPAATEVGPSPTL